jgi:hypothetical protein
LIGGTLDCSTHEATREHIVEAAFLSRAEFEGKTVFPPMRTRSIGYDKATGFAFPKYLGVREMAFLLNLRRHHLIAPRHHVLVHLHLRHQTVRDAFHASTGDRRRGQGHSGFSGEETWENTAAGLVSNVYYWDSLEALQQLCTTHAT